MPIFCQHPIGIVLKLKFYIYISHLALTLF
jgi:hypothetical protein